MGNAATGGEAADSNATPTSTGGGESADLPDYTVTDIDRMMDKVFGDHVHQNDGTHLTGGVVDDATWQA